MLKNFNNAGINEGFGYGGIFLAFAAIMWMAINMAISQHKIYKSLNELK